MKRKDAEEEEGGSNVVHCNLQQFERHEPNLHSIVNISGVVTIRLGLIYVCIVEQRTFSPATGSRPTTAEFCVFSAPASFATPMTSQARSRFTSLKQTSHAGRYSCDTVPGEHRVVTVDHCQVDVTGLFVCCDSLNISCLACCFSVICLTSISYCYDAWFL